MLATGRKSWKPHPSFGSVMSRVRGNANADIPPFVSLRGMSIGTEPGYLGVAHRPFTPEGPGIQNLRLASGVDGAGPYAHGEIALNTLEARAELHDFDFGRDVRSMLPARIG